MFFEPMITPAVMRGKLKQRVSFAQDDKISDEIHVDHPGKFSQAELFDIAAAREKPGV